QLDREIAVSQAVEGGKLVIALGDARPATRNTVRGLDTRFFDSAVARIDPRRARGKRGGGLELVVAFKPGATPAQASASAHQGKDGLAYLTFDFPSFASAPADAPSTNPAR